MRKKYVKMKDLDKEKLYYLASTYSSKSAFIRNTRYDAVNYAAAKLAQEDLLLFEPIASCHEKSHMFGMPTGYEFWKRRDRQYIDRADAVLVLDIPGIEDSVGVQDEIAYAKELGK